MSGIEHSEFLTGLKELQTVFDTEITKTRLEYFFDELRDIDPFTFKKIINAIKENEKTFPRNLVFAFRQYGYVKNSYTPHTINFENCEECRDTGFVLFRNKLGTEFAKPCDCPKGKFKADSWARDNDSRATIKMNTEGELIFNR